MLNISDLIRHPRESTNSTPTLFYIALFEWFVGLGHEYTQRVGELQQRFRFAAVAP